MKYIKNDNKKYSVNSLYMAIPLREVSATWLLGYDLILSLLGGVEKVPHDRGVTNGFSASFAVSSCLHFAENSRVG